VPRRSDLRHHCFDIQGASTDGADIDKEISKMTDYVLIHGAWHGSWCWTRVRHLLAASAHRVFTPTLTGVGERSHLLSRDVGLDTHVADVANGGIVARHVADRMPERIRSLIYLDAFVPDDGKALLDYLPDNGKQLRELAVAHGDGWKVPPPPRYWALLKFI
jgi:pimeloyl-ACP methyl ester carboxylesterase